MPIEDACDGPFAELLHGIENLLRRAFAVGVSLGEELIGKADDLFLDGNGGEILFGQRQVLFAYVGGSYAGSGVPFANAGMERQPLVPQDVGPDDAVSDVGFGAVAVEVGSAALEDADIVQHGSLRNEIGVGMQFGMAERHVERLTGHAPAVGHQNIVCERVGAVEFLYYL